MIVRARTDDDIDACERVARAVHAANGYPPRPAAPDVRAFLTSGPALAAWVADDGGKVVGHVALNGASSPEVMALAAHVTGRPATEMAVVARLLVSPTRRRRGVGGALLTTAAAAAHERGLAPILDVATHFDGAQSLYERHGWTKIGQVRVAIDGCEPFEEFVYVAPAS